MNQMEHLSKSIGLLTANIKEKITKCDYARPYIKHRGSLIDRCEKKEYCEFQMDFGGKNFCKKTLPKHLTKGGENV